MYYFQPALAVLMPFSLEILLGSYGATASPKMWRYYPSSSRFFGYLTIRTKFILEYIGTSDWNMVWYYETHCQVENRTLSSSVAQCSTPGYHSFGILNQSLVLVDKQHILVLKSPFCYEWQLLSQPVNSSGVFNLKFHLWIRKISEAEDMKANGSNKISPTEFSRHMTKVFHNIGQVPKVTASFGHSDDNVSIERQSIHFAVNTSVWEVDMKLASVDLLKIRIDGPSIAFLDCYIKPTVIELQRQEFNLDASLTVTQLPLPQVKGEINLVQNHCAPNVIVLASDDHLFFTQDYFITNVALRIPPHLVKNNASSTNNLVFTRTGHLLVQTGLSSFIINTSSSEVYFVQGLPAEESLQFSSCPWCHQDMVFNQVFDDVMVVWNNKSSLYFSSNPAVGFTPLPVPSSLKDKNFTMLDAKVSGISLCVYFLLELTNGSKYNNSKSIAYTTLAYEELIWGDITPVLQDWQYSGNDSSWSFQFSPPNSLSMLIWNSLDVYYKRGEGESTKSIVRKGNFSSSDDKRIVQVATSNTGEYLVLCESNVLYYGRIGMDYIVQLESRFPAGQYLKMMFDLTGYAHVVTVNKSTSSISPTKYPLDNEIFNALHPAVSCPFVEFFFASSSSSNIVDKWGQFEFWGYLVHKRNEPNDIQLVWNPTDIFRVEVSERKEFYRDIIMLNKTFTFTETSSSNLSGLSPPSSFSVTILPTMSSMLCKRPFHKVFHIHLGCPPTRKAAVRDARFLLTPSLNEESSFLLELMSGDTFHPVVLLYDHDVVFKQVYSGFHLVEIGGRNDFKMQDNQGLGNSTESTIVSFEGSGMFKFSLNVNDENTSFCNKTLEFSVVIDVESETDYFLVEFACVAFITLLFINFLVVNYVLYRKSFLQRHEEDDEAKSRLQELQYLAQLQYFRANSAAVVPGTADTTDDTYRRAALVTGRSERRAHRRSSVFERVSKGVFEDLTQVDRRSKSLCEPPRDDGNNDGQASRRSTVGDINYF